MKVRKEIFILNIDDVLPNRFQPRIKFDEKAILELAESIKKHGVIQPIIVRKIADKYEIIAGERRYKASVIAGRKTIPAIITDVDDKESSEIALIENIQRQDMTPIEEAISYKKILDMGYITQSELAVKLGKTQSTVANKLRLLNLSEEVQEALLEEKISERHARSLLKIPPKDQPELLDKIIKERLTVRKTDQLISQLLNKKEGEKENMNNEEINRNYNIPNEPIIDNNTNESNKPLFNPFGGMEAPQPVQEPQPVSQPTPSVNPFEMPAGPAPMPEPQANPFEMPTGPAPMPEPQTNPFEMPAGPAPMPEPQANPFEMPTGPAPMPEPQANPFEMPAGPAPMPEPQTNPFEMPAGPAPMPEPQANPFEMPTGPAPMPEPQANPFEMPAGPAPMPEPQANPFEMPNTQNVESDTMNSNFSPMPNYPYPVSEELTPLMPEDPSQAGPSADLTTVINNIRDCIKQIESYGYKVDSDEADLSNTYEFTIKIEKAS